MYALDRVQRFATSRVGDLLVLSWGFAEAIFLPVVPDVALGLFALAAPRRLGRLFALTVLGAIVGTLALYALALAAPSGVERFLLALPGIHPSMVAEAQTLVAPGDPFAIAGFGPGTPLKVYTFAWAAGRGSLVPLLVGAIVNRLTRIGPAIVALGVFGWRAPGFLRRHERLLLVVYVLFFVALYAVYWG